MAKRAWVTERKWTPSPLEVKFEEKVATNGFNIIGIKEFCTKTEYLIEKDGIQQEHSIYHDPSISIDDSFDWFVRNYNTRKEYERLKALAEK